MKLALRAALAALFLCLTAQAQWTSVTASSIQNATGAKLAHGKLCFRPVDNAGKPISFSGAGGQTISEPACFDVTNGALPAGAKVLDAAQTNPPYVCYAVTLRDTATGRLVLGGSAGAGYDCVQPSGPTWSFDTFQPNLVPTALGTGNILPLDRGGTGTNTWTAARCVRVADDGTKLEASSTDCGGGSGGNGEFSTVHVGPASSAFAPPNQGEFDADLTVGAQNNRRFTAAVVRESTAGGSGLGVLANPKAAAGTIDGVAAAELYTYSTGGASYNKLMGLYAGVEHDSTGTLANASVLNVDTIWKDANAGAITNAYGVQVASQAGVAANNYGVFIADQGDGANDYGLYVAGGKSHLGDTATVGAPEPNPYFTVSETAHTVGRTFSALGPAHAGLGFRASVRGTGFTSTFDAAQTALAPFSTDIICENLAQCLGSFNWLHMKARGNAMAGNTIVFGNGSGTFSPNGYSSAVEGLGEVQVIEGHSDGGTKAEGVIAAEPAPGATTITVNWSANEDELGTGKILLNRNAIVNTGTALLSGNTVTFSGAPDLTTAVKGAVYFVLGSTATDYAPPCQGHDVLIDSTCHAHLTRCTVTDATHCTLQTPWDGTSLTGVTNPGPYLLIEGEEITAFDKTAHTVNFAANSHDWSAADTVFAVPLPFQAVWGAYLSVKPLYKTHGANYGRGLIHAGNSGSVPVFGIDLDGGAGGLKSALRAFNRGDHPGLDFTDGAATSHHDIALHASGSLGFGAFGAGAKLFGDTDQQLGLRSSGNSGHARFCAYNQRTDSANYERACLKTDGTWTGLVMEKSGAGLARPLYVYNVGGADVVLQLDKWKFTAAGNLLAGSDGGGDIGAAAASRPNNIYAKTSVNTPKLAGITDTAVVSNLNADLLDGYHSSAFAAKQAAADIITGARSGSKCLHTSADGLTITEAAADCGAGGGGTWGSITGTLSNQTDLQTALDTKANALLSVTAHTGNATLASTAMQRSIHTNTGAGAQIVLTLGTAQCTAGQSVNFYVTAAQTIKLVPYTGDQIMVLTDAVTNSITSDAVIGSQITLGCLAAGQWYMLGMNGSWTDTN